MRIDDFIVEPGREEHIARHNVSIDEVEDIVYGRHAHDHLEDEYFSITGRTEADRWVTVILAERRSYVFSLVTARDANRREQSLYRRWFRS